MLVHYASQDVLFLNQLVVFSFQHSTNRSNLVALNMNIISTYNSYIAFKVHTEIPYSYSNIATPLELLLYVSWRKTLLHFVVKFPEFLADSFVETLIRYSS